MSNQDRRAGQRDGASGRIDEDRISSADYRDRHSRGRSAEVNRRLTGRAGQRNPNYRETWPSCRENPNFVSELVDFGEE